MRRGIRPTLECFAGIVLGVLGIKMLAWGRRGMVIYNVPYNGDGYMFCITVAALGAATTLAALVLLLLLLTKELRQEGPRRVP